MSRNNSNFEIIEFNTKTTERKIIRFDQFYQAIGYAKSKEENINDGITITICNASAIQ